MLTPPLHPPPGWHSDCPKTQAGTTLLFSAGSLHRLWKKKWNPLVHNLAPAYLLSHFLLQSPGLPGGTLLNFYNSHTFLSPTPFSPGTARSAGKVLLCFRLWKLYVLLISQHPPAPVVSISSRWPGAPVECQKAGPHHKFPPYVSLPAT